MNTHKKGDTTMRTLLLTLLLCCASASASAAGIVTFIFDDASRSHNGWVAPFFESRGARAGFAIPANKVKTDWTQGMTYAQMLVLQEKGHEFIAHGYNHSPMADAATPLSTVQLEVVGGLQRLRAEGLNVSIFVAPASAMQSAFVTPHVRGIYSRAFTVYDTSLESGVQQFPLDPHRMHRTSLWSVGLTGAMQLIDQAVISDGLVVFYDHDPLLTDFAKSMPHTQVQQVVDYAISRGVEIRIPRDAIRIAELRHVNRWSN